MNDELIIKSLTSYIAFWGWHLIAIIFLLGACISTILWSWPFMIAFLVLMFGCEYVAIKRKGEFLNGHS